MTAQKPIAAIFALALLASCLACAQDATRNLAPNPSFEDGDARGPADWEPRRASGSTAVFEWADDVSHSGRRSVAIMRSADAEMADRWRAGFGREIGCMAGSEVTLSAWVKTEGATGPAQVQIYAIGIGGNILAQPTQGAVTGTTDWTQISVSLTAPDEPCYIMPYVGLKGTGRAWFDDVELMGMPGPGLPPNMDEAVYRPVDFSELDGYEMVVRSGKDVLQSIPDQPGTARATTVFYEATAKWDVTLTYLDEPDGASTIRLLVNGTEVGSVTGDETVDENSSADVEREITFEGIDIQRWMPVTIVGEQDMGEYARVLSLTFVPVGQYEGELLSEEQLPPPNDLRIWPSPSEWHRVTELLGRQAARIEGDEFSRVSRQIEAIDTPEKLRQFQADVRAALPEIFGRWTGESGSELNPQTVGRIELDYCTIEKVIIESEPGLYVPLHVYVPKGKPLPAPGVCITMGHAAEGKQYHLYHEFGLGLAQKGYVAVAVDPLGQGERRYWDAPPEELGARGGPVGQHHYELRRAFLVGRSLSGLRTRDTVRAVDYMLTRGDIIDPERIGVGGNSGGGQMALLTAACHPAVKVCCAAHPGGSCENTYYRGKRDQDRLVMSLIPPRPLIWIVGEDSGEEHHLIRESWLTPLYELFGAADAQEFEWVEGVHNLERPKREAAYAWLNRWFGMDAGREEGEIEPLSEEELRCTETGLVETSIGGVMPWDLDARLMREMAPERPAPPADAAAGEAFLAERRAAVLDKLKIAREQERLAPIWEEAGEFENAEVTVRKLVLEPEEGITIGALVIEPKAGATGPTIIHAAEGGKPTDYDEDALPWSLALTGRRVVSVDVRGKGELDIAGGAVTRVVEYDRTQWRRDGYGIAYANAGRTMMGARALDLVRVMDALDHEAGGAGRYELVGEGQGGAWVLIAAVADGRVARVTTIGTLSSWERLIEAKWHAVRDYFWVPRALDTFDLSDLPALTFGAEVTVIDPVDAMLHPLSAEEAAEDFAWAQLWCGDRLRIECED